MIVIEDKLNDIFSYLPSQNGFKPVFSWGDDKELNTFLSNSNEATTPYPLIWLIYPYNENHKKRSVKAKIELILAVKTNTEMLNKERLIKTYKGILIPLYDNILTVFQKASTVFVEEEYEVIKYPNYGDSTNTKTVDIWDALKVTFDLRFNDNFLKTIKF
jgi:hypothetical protein